MNYLVALVACVASNYLWELRHGRNWDKATERTFFQSWGFVVLLVINWIMEG